jgi:hypothetical protein
VGPREEIGENKYPVSLLHSDFLPLSLLVKSNLKAGKDWFDIFCRGQLPEAHNKGVRAENSIGLERQIECNKHRHQVLGTLSILLN